MIEFEFDSTPETDAMLKQMFKGRTKMKLIDKDKLQKNYSYYCNHLQRHVVDVDDIENMPTVDAKPIRHGYWLYDRLCTTNGGTYGVQRCSNCGYYYKDFGDEWNYCPHCGAKMDAVEE